MEGLTGLVAIVFALIAVSRKEPGAALGIVVVSMMIWPEYLRVPLGVSEMSAPRLVALAVLAKFHSNGRLQSTKHLAVDRLVVWLWIWTVIAVIFAGSDFSYIAQMIGRGLDTVLLYFVARCALRAPSDISPFLRILIFVAIPIGIQGMIEAATSYSPYEVLQGHRRNLWIFKGNEYRYGFLRATSSTSVSIYFGMAMMMILGMIWSMRANGKSIVVLIAGVAFSLLGALSSMSSGPWLACITLIFLSVFEKRTYLIKPLLLLLLISSVMLEFLSNRHFYNLIDYVAIDSRNAWYRTRLLEIAFSQWQEFWLLGVGTKMPHHWGALLDGREHIDVVNHFLIVALYGGIPAAWLYIASHYKAVKSGIQGWQESESDLPRRTLLFGLMCTLIAVDFSSMSVGLFGPPLLLSNLLLGALVSVSADWKCVAPSSDELAGKDAPPF